MTRRSGLIAPGLCAMLTACGASDPDTPEDLSTALATARTQNITRIVSALSAARAPAADPAARTAVAFDGATTALALTHPNGSRVSFGGAAIDSERKRVTYTPVANPPAFWTGGHSMTSAEVTDTRIRFASVETSWETDEPTSYIAFGFWEDHGRAGTDITPSFGAFADGPEIAHDRVFSWETFTTNGTATYNGVASGFYAYRIPGTPDSAETGLFQTDLTLELDLASRTLSGNTGSDGVRVLSDGQDRTLPITVQLAATPVNANGTFTSSAFTLGSTLIPITESSGSWSGRLSNRAINEQPRLASGTLNGAWTDARMGEGAMTGAWIAGGQEP